MARSGATRAQPPTHSESRLALTGLSIGYRDHSGSIRQVVSEVDIELRAGEILGLAGESGCGKSTTGLSLMGRPAITGVRLAGSASIDGVDIYELPHREVRLLWGRRIAFVAQGAGSALNPVRSIGFQLEEPLRHHRHLTRKQARERAIELLAKVGIPESRLALSRFPHQFSGGQQQRIGLAMTTACQPEILVLDEPTSALDVTTQREVNNLIKRLVEDEGTAALYISHDLAMLASLCDELVVMYAGEVAEQGMAVDVIARPRHPYTAALVDAIPRLGERGLPVGIPGRPPSEVLTEMCAYADRCRFVVDRCRAEHPALDLVEPGRLVRCLRTHELGAIPPEPRQGSRSRTSTRSEPLLALSDVSCRYGPMVAVDGVSVSVLPGEKLGIVGESGSGKSTLLRAIVGLHPPSAGAMDFDGTVLAPSVHNRPRSLRRAIQLVFQDPDTSLNPRQTVAQILARPITLFRPEVPRSHRQEVAADLLSQVRLDPAVLDRRPHELSGGQRQRVAVARAFAAQPRVLLCDEIVSALDVSVAASVLELLANLVDENETAMIFVTHNLAVVASITDQLAVMKDGRIVEQGLTAEVIGGPRHPYTQQLLAAV